MCEAHSEDVYGDIITHIMYKYVCHVYFDESSIHYHTHVYTSTCVMCISIIYVYMITHITHTVYTPSHTHQVHSMCVMCILVIYVYIITHIMYQYVCDTSNFFAKKPHKRDCILQKLTVILMHQNVCDVSFDYESIHYHILGIRITHIVYTLCV